MNSMDRDEFALTVDDLLLQQQQINQALRQQLNDQREQLQAQTQLIAKLQQQLEQLLRKLYGKKTEKCQAGEDESISPSQRRRTTTNSASSGRNGHHNIPANLARERVEHDVSEAQQHCQGCGNKMQRIGQIKRDCHSKCVNSHNRVS